MKKTFSFLAILLTAFTFVAAQAFATGTSTKGDMQGQKEGMHGGMKGAYGEASSAGTFYKGNDIIGKEVKNQKGEKLGSVEDVAIGQDGRIAYVILARGEVLGMGGSLVPIPWKMVNVRAPAESRGAGQRAESNAELIVNVSQKDLENAPTFKSDEWNRLSEANYDQKVYSYFEKHRGAAGEMQGDQPAGGLESGARTTPGSTE